MMCSSSPAWTATRDDHGEILWDNSVQASKHIVMEDVSTFWDMTEMAAPPRHIPAFSPTPLPPRRTPNAGRSSFDHVPLDVDKKMFARRSTFATSCESKKIPMAIAGVERQCCGIPPRFINVVSPVEHLHQLRQHSDSYNNIVNDGGDGSRMPEATIQVLESILMDDDDGLPGEE